MSFATLYDYCQSLPLPISRKLIKAKVCDLTRKEVTHIRTELDTEITRGFYLDGRNEDHKIVEQLGSSVVATARGLNRCWERFILVKEMMHMFGSENEAADDGDKFETLLAELTNPAGSTSPATRSEYLCFWMALAALCPEEKRLEYQQERDDSEIDDFTIASQLRIPEMYVPRLFEPRYRGIVDTLISA
ncbi:MAG: hypothetical protein ACJAUS_001943 [Qipengyuania sp.]|jgi:hypothetical protein